MRNLAVRAESKRQVWQWSKGSIAYQPWSRVRDQTLFAVSDQLKDRVQDPIEDQIWDLIKESEQ